MIYRNLGRGGPKISCVGLGTFQFGGEWGKNFNEYDVEKILDRAQSLGINFLDTAECYGNHLSEKLIGKAIKKSRSKWIIATKFGHKFKAPFFRQNAFGVKEVLQQLNDSLKALQTENIDLYQFHSGNNQEFLNDDLWCALQKEKEKGKIRFLGISIKNTMVADNNLKQITVAGEKSFSSIQLVYNRLQSQAKENAIPLCKKLNLGVLARIPLCQGNLTGKYNIEKSFKVNDIRSLNSKEFHADQIRRINEIREKEVPPGTDLAQWALAWCLKNSSVTAVIPGCKSVEHVESNAKAVDLLNSI